jgi:hypothetical protein
MFTITYILDINNPKLKNTNIIFYYVLTTETLNVLPFRPPTTKPISINESVKKMGTWQEGKTKKHGQKKAQKLERCGKG